MATSFNNLPSPVQTNNDVNAFLKSVSLTPRTITVDPNTGKVLQITVEETLTALQITAIQTKYPELTGIAPSAVV